MVSWGASHEAKEAVSRADHSHAIRRRDGDLAKRDYGEPDDHVIGHQVIETVSQHHPARSVTTAIDRWRVALVMATIAA